MKLIISVVLVILAMEGALAFAMSSTCAPHECVASGTSYLPAPIPLEG